jgi:hypothetical protein
LYDARGITDIPRGQDAGDRRSITEAESAVPLSNPTLNFRLFFHARFTIFLFRKNLAQYFISYEPVQSGDGFSLKKIYTQNIYSSIFSTVRDDLTLLLSRK